MNQKEIRYEPGSTEYSFDEDDYSSFLRYKQKWNPGFQFDTDWIDHLRQNNGGIPVTNLFQASTGETFALDFMYPFKGSNDPGLLSVGRVHTLACESEAFDYNCIPFGRLANGDLFCLDHREHLGGPAPVVIWLHEESEEDAPKFEFVASTFRDFVQMLYRDDGEE